MSKHLLVLVKRAGVPVKGKKKRPGAGRFDGDLETARLRLSAFAAVACTVLDASTLNLASYHIEVYLDAAKFKPTEVAKVTVRTSGA